MRQKIFQIAEVGYKFAFCFMYLGVKGLISIKRFSKLRSIYLLNILSNTLATIPFIS